MICLLDGMLASLLFSCSWVDIVIVAFDAFADAVVVLSLHADDENVTYF